MNNAAYAVDAADVADAVIHTAVAADIERLVAYERILWDQTEYAATVEYDVDTMIDTTLGLIEDDIVLYAVDGKGRVVGLLCVMISPFLMNRNYLSACEWGFYVNAEYRRIGLADRLLDRAEEILRARNVTFFTMVALENLRPKAVGRFYERRGFKRAESDYMKVL